MTSLNGLNLRDGCIHRVKSVQGSQLASRPVKVPSGTVWPNGEFGLGYHSRVEECDPVGLVKAGGVSLEAMRLEALRVRMGVGAPPLDLTSLPNSHTPKNRPETYGRKGMTNRGAKMVRNAGYLLQRRAGKKHLTFLTLTLPEMGSDGARAVAETWGETMRQLIQWLSRKLQASGLPAKVVLVTELQPERQKAGSLCVLHVHGVFQGRKNGKTWAVSCKELRAWWLARLSRVTGGQVQSLTCCDMKRVEKDAGNYLSKYMSKGAEAIGEFAEMMGWECVPRQWWNMSKQMRDEVNAGCLRSPQIMSIVEELVNMYWDGKAGGYFKFVRPIEVMATELQSFVVGFWGKFNNSGIIDLTALASGVKSA